MRMLVLLTAVSLLAPLLALASPPDDETRKFRAYLDADWKRWMEEYPEVATGVGYPGQDARWTDDSPIGIQRKDKHLAESIAQLKEIRRDALPESEKLNFDLYSQLLDASHEGLKYGDDPFPFRFVVPHRFFIPIH